MCEIKSDYKLTSSDHLTALARASNVFTWRELVYYIQSLPYGRNTDRSDFSLVLKEKQGSCSSKHALLKGMADLNEIPYVELILCMYRMNVENTPGITGDSSADEQEVFPFDYIPEAHCYLIIDGRRMDFTSSTAHISRIENDILQEIEIQPDQVVSYKVNYHKQYLKSWISENDLPYDFDDIWATRERCIHNLSLNLQ